jgi:hypothetical protein
MSKINDKVLSELLSHQLKKVDGYKKLSFSDITRIAKYLDKSIFNTDECVLWKGYVTNCKNKSKGVYVNFYFKQKKYALHRLLYLNYIGSLYDDEYLKFTCPNKGMCCNINHFKKFDNEHELIPKKIIDNNPTDLKKNLEEKKDTKDKNLKFSP